LMRARGGLPARFVAILLLVVACAGCSPVLRLLRPHADPNVAPAVREIDPIETRLQAADDASAHLMLSEIGRTNTPDPKLPVWRMVYRPFRPELKSVMRTVTPQGRALVPVVMLSWRLWVDTWVW